MLGFNLKRFFVVRTVNGEEPNLPRLARIAISFRRRRHSNDLVTRDQSITITLSTERGVEGDHTICSSTVLLSPGQV